MSSLTPSIGVSQTTGALALRTTLKGDATHFHFTATVDAYFNGARIFSDQDGFSIPRDFM